MTRPVLTEAAARRVCEALRISPDALIAVPLPNGDAEWVEAWRIAQRAAEEESPPLPAREGVNDG